MKKVIFVLVAVLMTAMVVSCHTPHEGVPDNNEILND